MLKGITRNLEFITLVVAVVSVAGLLAVERGQHSAPAVPGEATRVRIVTIDPVELANAERAIASQLLTTRNGKTAVRQSVTLKLFRVGREMRGTIRKIAGPGTIVLVKQAVVFGHVPDITAQVLKRLGLPAKVPTVDLTHYLTSDVAATTLSFSQVNAALHARANQQIINGNKAAAKAQQQHADSVIP